MIPIGSKVYLKVCRYGELGTVIRRERVRLVVLWPDLDYIARHHEDSLKRLLNYHSEESKDEQYRSVDGRTGEGLG
jgi:hypothetical protein